jgi:5'-methylthioadenosine phosphorylase
MGKLGVILGSGAAGLIPTHDGLVSLDRHGDPYALPHAVDHEGNLRALAGAGCDRVLGIASVGGLRPDLGPGTYVVPDDFIALDIGPVTSLYTFEAHQVARFDETWRREVVDALRAAPRIETAAEVGLIAQHAHVVGMTVASECIVASEMGLPYAALCVVDNLANGVTTQALTAEDVRKGQEEHRPELEAVLASALGTLSR